LRVITPVARRCRPEMPEDARHERVHQVLCRFRLAVIESLALEPSAAADGLHAQRTLMNAPTSSATAAARCRRTSLSLAPYADSPRPPGFLLLRCGLLRGLAGVLCLALVAGCGGESTTASPNPEAAPAAPVEQASDVKPAAAEKSEPAPEMKIDVAASLASAQEHLDGHEFDKARDALAELQKHDAEFTDDDRMQIAKFEQQLNEAQAAYVSEQRAERLAKAKQLLADGDIEESGRLLTAVLANAPTPEQQQEARELQMKIEEHRQVRRKLRIGLELMASKERGRVREGQQMLWDEPEVAFPMLLESLKSDNPVLVANCLEMLRRLNQPERTVPAMVAVLSRVEQSASWPDTIRELQKVPQGGAGKLLLELATSAETPEQAIAALNALEGVVDPPQETLITLLPMLHRDGPELAAALGAAYHAIEVHRQQDLTTRRGLPMPLTPEQEQQLLELPARLLKIIDAAPVEGNAAEAVLAARRLAVATRQLEPIALPGVKLVRVTHELPESPGGAVFDGVWDSTEVTTMWRHPPKPLTTIVLDLGEERTITGVRVWNGNEQGAPHRGWKEVEIYVSNSPSPTSPVATAIIPMAPGAPGTPDYGTTLPVPFARGRYVKLQMLSVWRDDGTAGLSELQLLGY